MCSRKINIAEIVIYSDMCMDDGREMNPVSLSMLVPMSKCTKPMCATYLQLFVEGRQEPPIPSIGSVSLCLSPSLPLG